MAFYATFPFVDILRYGGKFAKNKNDEMLLS